MLAHRSGVSYKPFYFAPDARQVYVNAALNGVFTTLIGRIQKGTGPLLLLGEPGIGKSTVLRKLVHYLQPGCLAAHIQARETQGFEPIIHAACGKLGVPVPPGAAIGTAVRALIDASLARQAQGIGTVLMIDDADLLSDSVLRNLHNVAHLGGDRRLFPTILAGRPEFLARLSGRELRPLLDRVAGTNHLRPIATHELGAFVMHQLRAAHCAESTQVDDDAVQRIAYHSGGIPGVVKVLCGESLERATAAGRSVVTGADVDAAARAIEASEPGSALRPTPIGPRLVEAGTDASLASTVDAAIGERALAADGALSEETLLARAGGDDAALGGVGTTDRERAGSSGPGMPALDVATLAQAAAGQLPSHHPIAILRERLAREALEAVEPVDRPSNASATSPANAAPPVDTASAADVGPAPRPDRMLRVIAFAALALGIAGNVRLYVEQPAPMPPATATAPAMTAPAAPSPEAPRGIADTAPIAPSPGPAPAIPDTVPPAAGAQESAEAPVVVADPVPSNTGLAPADTTPDAAMTTSADPDAATRQAALPAPSPVDDMPPSTSNPAAAAPAPADTPTARSEPVATETGITEAGTAEINSREAPVDEPVVPEPPVPEAAAPATAAPATAVTATAVTATAAIGTAAIGTADRKDAGADRVAGAPADPAPAATTSPAVAAAPLPSGDPAAGAVLVDRGVALLRSGDVAAARLFFERAAANGIPAGAIGMARTYDPKVLRELGAIGVRPDPAKAIEWYRRAAGVPEADLPLRRLQATTP